MIFNPASERESESESARVSLPRQKRDNNNNNMDLITVPLAGLLKMLRINVNGVGHNPADDPFHDLENGGHAPQSQFAMMQDERARPLSVQEVVIECYNAARASVQGVGNSEDIGPILPMRSSFLWDTWITMYRCPFMEKEPHRVRWIDGNHPIIQFLHYHRHPQKASCLAVHRRKFGTMVQYAENEVQQFLDLLVECCESMGLELAGEFPPPPPQASDRSPLGYAEGGEEEEEVDGGNDAYTDIDIDIQSSYGDSVAIDRDMKTEDQIYLQRVYMDIMVSMDRRQTVPRYANIFYNMCVSQCPIRGSYPLKSIRVYWLYENHAFTAHPALEHYPPIDAFQTEYGNCLVYQEGAITAVVESLIREFMAEGLEIDQRTAVIATAPPAERAARTSHIAAEDPKILAPLPPPAARDLNE